MRREEGGGLVNEEGGRRREEEGGGLVNEEGWGRRRGEEEEEG